jgi:hypothetical protein
LACDFSALKLDHRRAEHPGSEPSDGDGLGLRLLERPPVNIFSISNVFSVGYGLSPSLQELRSFGRKTGIFFDISGG